MLLLPEPSSVGWYSRSHVASGGTSSALSHTTCLASPAVILIAVVVGIGMDLVDDAPVVYSLYLAKILSRRNTTEFESSEGGGGVLVKLRPRNVTGAMGRFMCRLKYGIVGQTRDSY